MNWYDYDFDVCAFQFHHVHSWHLAIALGWHWLLNGAVWFAFLSVSFCLGFTLAHIITDNDILLYSCPLNNTSHNTVNTHWDSA